MAGRGDPADGRPPHVRQHSPLPVSAPTGVAPPSAIALDAAGAGHFDGHLEGWTKGWTTPGCEAGWAGPGGDDHILGQRKAPLGALVPARDAAHG